MSGFDLYYWPVPFRGQFIRSILAYGGQAWDEYEFDALSEMMGHDVSEQPIAFMGPPVLVDRQTHFAISQMPAIALYLGEKLDLVPATAIGRALSAKVVCDANDVIDELTLNGGRQMWTAKTWESFLPRLGKWMRIFQDTGERHGLTAGTGFLLGTAKPGIADLVTATLWSTMSDRFPDIAALCEETAPGIWGLSRRVQSIPELAELERKSFEKYGDAYCGGDIEASLRNVAGPRSAPAAGSSVT